MITIYGASDDLIEVEGCDGANEFNSHERGPVMWRGDLIAPGGLEAVRVHAVFDGCWSVAVGQVDEDVPLPEWPVAVRQHPSLPYSAAVVIDAPAGTRLDNVWPSDDEQDEARSLA